MVTSLFVVVGEVYYVVVVSRCFAVVGITTISCSEVSAEGTVGGCGSDGTTICHVTELRTAAEQIDMTVADDGVDVAMHRLGKVDATSVETLDVGIVNNPCDITFVVRSADAFHTGTCHFSETSTVDIAFGIVIINGCLRLIKTSQVELGEITSCH